MLNGGYYSTTIADFGFSGEREVNTCRKRDNGRDWGLWWRFIFVVAERAAVEYTVGALVVCYCSVAEVDS